MLVHLVIKFRCTKVLAKVQENTLPSIVNLIKIPTGMPEVFLQKKETTSYMQHLLLADRVEFS